MKSYFLPVLIVALVLGSCSKMDENTIAEVNGHEINEDQIGLFMPIANFKNASLKEKEALLEEICRQYQTKMYLDETNDLDSGRAYWEKSVWYIQNIANDTYNHLVIDKILTPAAEKKLYRRLGQSFKPAHILISHNASPKSKNDRSREDALKLSKNIVDEVSDSNFTDLARRYSDDSSVKNNGGELNWGRIGSWVDEFENTVYNMEKGEISGPVETDYGFHIIYLKDKKTTTLPPFQEYRDDLRQTAFNLWRNKFMERHEFVFDSLASHNPVVYNDSLLADFIDRFVKLSENVFTSKQFTAFDILDIFSDSLVVGHLGEQPINKNWIKQYLKVISLQVPPRFDSVAGFKRFVEENLAGSLLYKTGLKMGINETPPFRNKEAVYLAKKSHDLFEKLYIYEDIRPEKKDLSAFYENHKDSLYTVPKRVEVLEILVKDSTRADSLLEELRQGADFGDLAQKHSVRNIGKKNRGRIPAFKKSQYGSMGIAAFNMRNGELSGPFKIGKYYSVIKRLNVLPKSYKTMDQIRYRLLTDYRSVYTPEKRKKVYKILNKKYPYKINRNYFK